MWLEKIEVLSVQQSMCSVLMMSYTDDSVHLKTDRPPEGRVKYAPVKRSIQNQIYSQF